MQLFSEPAAQHYCSSFTPQRGHASGSIIDFLRLRLSGTRTIIEGTPIFEEYKSCSLRDTDRALFLSISHYRRCIDLLLSSASPWAYVTMYYGCWFAAKAILGMFGATIIYDTVIDVRKNLPGSQELHIRKIGNRQGDESTTYKGSHRRFWDLFYRAVAVLVPFVTPSYSFALLPVSSNPVWQIDNRNGLNYDTHRAFTNIHDFATGFVSASFPGSLPAPLATQYSMLEAMILVANDFAKQLQLKTDALAMIGSFSTRGEFANKLIYTPKAPHIVSKTQKGVLAKK